MVKKVVIPVAGLGTRGLPFTKEIPKEMLPIIDTPAIQFIVDEAVASGIEQVVLITGKGKSALEDYFCPSPHLEDWLRKHGKTELAEKIAHVGRYVEIVAVRQKEPLGLGHAILCAKPVIGNEMFGVCLGDEIFPPWESKPVVPALKALVHAATGLNQSSVVGVMRVDRSETHAYGIVDLDGKDLAHEPLRVVRTIEKPPPEKAPSEFALIGRYVFEPAIFDYLKEVRPGVGGEIQLTDALDILAKTGRLLALQLPNCRYDIGNHFFYVKAQVDALLRRTEFSEKLRKYVRGIA